MSNDKRMHKTLMSKRLKKAKPVRLWLSMARLWLNFASPSLVFARISWENYYYELRPGEGRGGDKTGSFGD